MMESTLSVVSSKALLTLFGACDQHLRRIRNVLGVRITARDDRIDIVGPESAVPVGKVMALLSADDEEDRTVARASAIAECAIVYTMAIGGPAAAKLVSRRIHPMKTTTEVPIAEVVEKLQGVLRGRPPPWLRKAMGEPPAAPEEA